MTLFQANWDFNIKSPVNVKTLQYQSSLGEDFAGFFFSTWIETATTLEPVI